MKNIIFSIYIKNTDKKPSRKHDNTRKQLDRHLVRLLKNHKEYAKKCNADYMVFVDDEKWLEFKKKYEQYQFDTINLYKIYVLEKLADRYDNILYLDLDVIPNTDQSFFEVFDMNKINVHAPNAEVENVWSEKHVKNFKQNKISYDEILTFKDKYDMHVKAMCKKAMLITDGLSNSDMFISNTAIVGGNSSSIKKLNYIKNLDNMIELLNKVKEEEFFGKKLTNLFFANNEVFFHYILDKYQIEWYNIPYSWHTYILEKMPIKKDLKNANMIHLINKKFDELWNIIDE